MTKTISITVEVYDGTEVETEVYDMGKITGEEAIKELEKGYRTMSMCIDVEDCKRNNDTISMAISAIKEMQKRHDHMKIYIVERDTPSYKPEPEVFTDGNKALETVKTEYTDQMEELGTSQEKADAGYGSCGCYWNFDNDSYIGDCLIDRDIDGDRWEWRITAHEIEVN